MQESARGRGGAGECGEDSRNAGGAAQSAEDADCACAPRVRVSGLQDQAGQSSASAAGREDPVRGTPRGSVRLSDAEVRRPVQGEYSPEDAASHSAEDCGADPRDQSCDPWVGRVLQTRSRAETLPPARWVGGAAAVVASSPAVALQGVEDTSDAATPRRVGAGRPDFADSFFAPAA